MRVTKDLFLIGCLRRPSVRCCHLKRPRGVQQPQISCNFTILAVLVLHPLPNSTLLSTPRFFLIRTMENAKEKTSRSGSKVNLNESSLPLLEDEEVQGKTEKVAIEMESRGEDGGEEKSDSGKEKVEGEDGQLDGETNDTKKKDKKEKKKKEKKEKGHNRSCSISDRLTAGLNLLDRDDRSVNDHVSIVFEDVLAEPDSNHGFDGVWRLAFLVFSGTKLWVYRVISAILALPCGLLWGLVFSLLTLLNVWVISPTLRLFDVFLHILRRVWSGIIRTFLDPVFQSVGQCFSGVQLNMHSTRQEP